MTETHLAAITQLGFLEQSITVLKAGDFDGLTALTWLSLQSNQLSLLPEGIFDGLTALTFLDLSSNQLSSLPEGIFDNLNALTYLYLQDNQLSSLPEGIFDNLTTLNLLYLWSNQLSSLPEGIFDNLNALEELSLSTNQLSSLPESIFDNLNTLTSLSLSYNQLSSLPESIFDNLNALTSLSLHSNSVDPLPLTVSLEKVGVDQFKAVAPSGAPFDLVLPLSVTDGSISGGATTITIPAGSVESQPLTVVRTPGTSAAVTMDIGTLPSPPTNHSGYALVKSTDLPLEVIGEEAVPVTIPDANLRAKIESALGKTSGDPISAADMATLTALAAQDAAISDLTGLETATNLTELQLWDNNIADISAVTGLTKLIELVLADNAVADLSPLVANTGLGENTEIDVQGNPLDYPSIYTHIPALQARNVFVEFDRRTPTTLVKVSGDNQQQLIDTVLPDPFVVEVQDANSVAFAGVPVAFAVTAGGGTLSATSTTTDANGRAQSTLTLGNSAGTNTVSVSVQGIAQSETFTAEATSTNAAPVFTDGTSTTRTIAENTATGINIGTAIAATDADNDELTYALGGIDAAAFDIDSTTGQLQTNDALDYETKSVYTVTVSVSDGTDTATITVTIDVTDIVEAEESIVQDEQPEEVGELPPVQLIYFLPNDRSFDSDVVDAMKTRVLEVQSFYREQMRAHGYGNKTFHFETDDQGDPVVHRVDGLSSDGSYLRSYPRVGAGNVLNDLRSTFDPENNILFIVADHSTYDDLGWGNVTGFGRRWGKNSGYALLPANFSFGTAAHELGHAFGLQHDFSDGANIMSYGPGWNQLSACSAGFLAGHPYFNPAVPIDESHTSQMEDLLSPTIELISPLRYPAGSTNVSLQFRVTASGAPGLHQVLLFTKSRAPHPAAGSHEVKACQVLSGEQNVVVEFDYDGVIPSDSFSSLSTSPAHYIAVEAVDTEGNLTGPLNRGIFVLAEDSPHHLATFFRRTSSFSPEIYGAKFSPDGTLLAVNSSAGIQIWDTATRAIVASFSRGSSSLAFSPDGAILASGSTSTFEANIKLWDVANQSLIATLEGHTGGPTGVHSVAFSPDGATLASGSGDQTIKLWDVANQSLIATLEGHTSHVFSVAFSSDGTLASGSRDGTIKLWDVATRTNTATLDGDTGRVFSVAFSPDGTLLASSTDGPMLLWDVATRTQAATLDGHGEASFSPDGTILTSGGREGEVLLWDVATGGKVAMLGHPGQLWDAAGLGVNGVFSPTGALLASVAINGVELWNASEWTGVSPVTSVFAHPDSVALVALYNSTNGPNWQDKTNWLSGRPIGEWKGVLTNSLGRVYDLTLAWNRLSGTIPAELGNLAFLSSLYLYNNHLSGQIPSEIGDLSNLIYVELNYNRLSGQIPSELGNLTKLERLYLHRNQLSGQIPSELGNLTNLTRLLLSNNQLTGTIPAELGNLTNLTHLALSNNQLTGTIPAELGNLTNLTSLWLSDNQLTGCVPAGLRDVANNDLEVLNLPDCGQEPTHAETVSTPICDRTPQVRDAIVAAVSDVSTCGEVTKAHLTSDITSLFLNGQAITTLQAGDFEDLTSLTELRLYDNQLMTLPADLFDGLTALTALNLVRNQLSSLPAGIFDDLDSLKELHLGRNRLSSLPAGIFDNLNALTTLNLSANQLSSLPAGIFDNLNALTRLYLAANQLSSLPAGIFDNLNAALTTLDLGLNSVNPLPLTVSLEKVGGGQFKATVPAGAPFDIVLPLLVTDGQITGGVNSITVPAGGVESEPLTVTRTPSTTSTVTVDIGTLPGLPANHLGYALVKSPDLPLEVISTPTDGTACRAGDVLAPGESCTYPGTEATFSVLDDGKSQLDIPGAPAWFNNASIGGSLRISATINDERYHFVAKELASGSWEIEEVGDSGDQEPETPEEAPEEPETPEEPGNEGGTPILTASTTEAPLTEAMLHESVVTLTLSGGVYDSNWNYVSQSVTVSGITGVTFRRHNVDRVSDTVVTVKLEFEGDIDSDATLTFTVGAEAMANYNGPPFTVQIPVTANTESVVASTTSPLTEATLHESVVTLTLSGRAYHINWNYVSQGVTVSGITGVTFRRHNVDRVSDTVVTVKLEFDGTDFDTDATLTFTIGVEAIANYNGPPLTAQIPVTAIRENSLAANFPNPFNPETWISYQLAEPAEVTLTIYALNGQVVRRLALGHQSAGIYAAYWDGRSEFGKPVASGVYFYRLTAGDFSATRKMLIQK